MNRWAENIRIHHALIFTAVICAWLIGDAAKKPLGDFANYWFASKFLVEGRFNPDVYETFRFNLDVLGRGYDGLFLSYTAVPPFSALMYVPFVWVEPFAAKVMWNTMNVLLLLFTMYRMHAKSLVPARALCLLPLLLFLPLRNNFFEGQSYLLLCFLLNEGWIAHVKGGKWITGFCWGLAVLLKILPAILLLYLLAKRDFKSAAITSLCIVSLTLASCLVIDPGIWLNYLIEILPRLAKGEINNMYAQNYQSLHVMLRQLLVPDAMHNPNAPFNSSTLFTVVTSTFTALVTGTLIAFTENKHRAAVPLWIAGSLLVSGYGNSFGLVLLAFPFSYAALLLRSSPLRSVVILVCIFLACNIPVHGLSGLPWILQFPRFVLLLIIWISIVYGEELNIKRTLTWSACLLVILVVPKLLKRNDDNSRYWLEKEEALLIYDYTVQRDSIKLNCFDNRGPWTKTVAARITIAGATDTTLYLRGENVRKPMLINGDSMLYLSDKGRGVGFYTLRCMPAP